MKMKKIWRNITATFALTSMAFPFWIDSKTETTNRATANTINILLVLLVAFAGDRVISHFLSQANLRSNFRYSRVYNTTGQADILLIGNSRGHAFYQPTIKELTGQSTLNLSYNALPVSIARALVEDYFDLYNAPKKIVLEVSMLNKTEDNVINAFKVYQNHSQRIASVISEASPKTSGACALSNLYSFNTEVFHRSLYYMKKNDDDWILTKKINAGLIAGSVNIEPMQFDVTKERFDNLKALIQSAKENGTEVQLVVAPYYPNYRKNISNLNEFIFSIERETGLKVHDYSGFVTEDQYFSDYLHLNKKGSIEFMKKLKQDGVL
jgi:hypothetical protein